MQLKERGALWHRVFLPSLVKFIQMFHILAHKSHSLDLNHGAGLATIMSMDGQMPEQNF